MLAQSSQIAVAVCIRGLIGHRLQSFIQFQKRRLQEIGRTSLPDGGGCLFRDDFKARPSRKKNSEGQEAILAVVRSVEGSRSGHNQKTGLHRISDTWNASRPQRTSNLV